MRKGATSPKGARQRPPADQPEASLIWGIHPVTEVLRRRPGLVQELYLAGGRDDERVAAIAELAAAHRIPLERSGLPPAAAELPGHQGVAARVAPPSPLSLAELLQRLPAIDPEPASTPSPAASPPPLLLVLDSLQDPHNLGAVLRSAAAFGVNGVILPKDRSAPLSGTVLKAAAGTAALLDICRTTNLAAALSTLKQQGFWIYGASGEAGNSLYETDFSGPTCLVLGNEQKGIRPLLKSHCDFLLAIPLAAGVESLNVSVAAGIMLAEIRRPAAGPA
ncbi:MAG: 23S rRNA (guanosine(2251)-2'-O)-methyltransferase RlmB [Desulfurivibrio sp.]|nr:23S rRNA (guanosine(2251)-2'-O)-methyltransferase RlmB [Desulfurivibrio sp.]